MKEHLWFQNARSCIVKKKKMINAKRSSVLDYKMIARAIFSSIWAILLKLMILRWSNTRVKNMVELD